ncbi:MAG: SixA phosphatase family protein [Planctomycetota bacterium]
MSRELLVLRHAKSAWDTDAPSDFARPLSKRGRKAAPRVGRWLRAHRLQPDLVVASTALRVRQTVHRLLPELEAEPEMFWADGIYCASLGALMSVLAACPDSPARVLLVGHNPGLELLVEHLTGVAEPFPTAALARIELPDDWTGLRARCGSLEAMIRPRELEE